MQNIDDLRECDLVMKGGITSGVVYPLAVREISKHFRLRCVGGTSAGAIAAAAAAAAECGRQSGNSDADGFEGLERMSEWLGQKGNLISLFRPNHRTRPLFRLLLVCLERSWGSIFGLLASLPWYVYVVTVAGMMPGVLWILLCPDRLSGWTRVYSMAAGALLGLLGGLFAAVLVLLPVSIGLLKAVAANFLGICTGLDHGSSQPALTTWVHHQLNRLAGKDERTPLTFGDLWKGGEKGLEEVPGQKTRRSVSLEMLTTCLNHSRPYRIPEELDRFYFRPDQLREFFPEEVVQWMMDHEPRSECSKPLYQGEDVLVRLPRAEDLPVIVGVRLSLSFPILLSGVPLYDVDYTLRRNSEARSAGTSPDAQMCWFSDGGICSNFPIHSFDAPLPSRPTFGINLKGFHPEKNSEEDAVWLPDTNVGGIHELWTHLKGESGPAQVFSFLGMIIDTMQSWLDMLHTKLPGYRDRIVHISLTKQEGGLNLNMPESVISILGRRGRRAGEELSRAFRDPGGRAWTNHRWVRYRNSLSLLEQYETSLVRVYRRHHPGEPSLESLIESLDLPEGVGYAWKDPSQRDFAKQRTRSVVELAESWAQEVESFTDGAPRPSPILRAVPRT